MMLMSDTIMDEDMVIYVFVIPKPYSGGEAMTTWLGKAAG